MLLIERGEGVETKPIKTSYSPSAGTAYVTFENVGYIYINDGIYIKNIHKTGQSTC